MKFFHISDLHIGKQLHHYNLREDQQYILEKIAQTVEKENPDALLLAGDIYDSSVPGAEAVELLDMFLTRLSQESPEMEILVIAGNHDSGKRLSFASEILKKQRIHVAGLPPAKEGEYMKKVVLRDEWGKVNFYLLPFTKPSHLRRFREEPFSSYQEALEFLLGREKLNTKERNVILTHQFYTASGKKPEQSDSEVVNVGGIDQVDISVLKDFEYGALGHIHKSQNMGKNIRYCGTPLSYSVSESGQEKSITVVILEEKGKEPEIQEIPLKPLREVKKLKGSLGEIMEMAVGDLTESYVSITLTDDIEAYEPMEQLKDMYHRILELSVDNKRTRKVMDLSVEDVEDVDPLTAFLQFFREMNGREMSEDERKLAEKIVLQCTVENGEEMV